RCRRTHVRWPGCDRAMRSGAPFLGLTPAEAAQYTAAFPGKALRDRIFIEGIKFHGYHGLTRMERQVGVRLSVDVSLELSLDASGRSDDVRRTLDYRKVHQRVIEIGRGSSHRLLESYAVALLDAMFREF